MILDIEFSHDSVLLENGGKDSKVKFELMRDQYGKTEVLRMLELCCHRTGCSLLEAIENVYRFLEGQ